MSENINKLLITEEELSDYIIVPYRGKFKGNMWADIKSDDEPADFEKPADACVELVDPITNVRKRVSVNVDPEEKRLYIEENNFNCYWKKMKNAIFQRNRLQSFLEKTGLPAYADADDQVDLSLYENGNRQAVIRHDRITIIGKPLDEAARILQSKRASAMDNKKLRYVFSASNRFVHDKACPLVKNISDTDFRASEELPEGRTCCLFCTDMMYIRKGCGDDFKNCRLYQQFFRRGHIDEKELGKLINEYQADIHIEDKDTLRIKCGEDQWMLSLKPDGQATLMHNNYIMINEKERYISGGFHDQNLLPGSSAVRALHYLEAYKWEGHLTAMAARKPEEQDMKAAETMMDPGTGADRRRSIWTRIRSWYASVKARLSSYKR